MDPVKIALLIMEIYRLADKLGIVDLIGDQIYSKEPEELIRARDRLSSLQHLMTRYVD